MIVRKDTEKTTFFQIEYTTKKKGKMIEERKSKELSKLKIETICSTRSQVIIVIFIRTFKLENDQWEKNKTNIDLDMRNRGLKLFDARVIIIIHFNRPFFDRTFFNLSNLFLFGAEIKNYRNYESIYYM